MHKPIFLKEVSLSFSNTNCFENFSSYIYAGDRIAIIGRNGSGKSSLLNVLSKQLNPSSGELIMPNDLCIGHVEQTIKDYNSLSGGQRFNKRLSEVLASAPDVLLLDEPTNHLDSTNRHSLMRMLQAYHGTLVIASHDTDLLGKCANKLWHISDHQIHEFTGNYSDYIREITLRNRQVTKELALLKRESKKAHADLMQEQLRAKRQKAYGEKKNAGDKLSLRAAQARGQATSNKKHKDINDQKRVLEERRESLYMPEIIVPKFSLDAGYISGSNILSISHADIGYHADKIVLKAVNLTMAGKDRIGIEGQNATGKSTLLKAILNQEHIFKTGSWHVPHKQHIGFLDQHYANLNPDMTVIEHIRQVRPDWYEEEVKKHLADFLFRKNESWASLISHLSGGEKARLSLSLIAAKPPQLLILDEITNNLDIETKEHVIQVLKEYPGAMIVVSHEENFLQAIGINHFYNVANSTLLAS